MIHLIGPGGAGKSTAGTIVAELLGCPCRDLDRLFEERHGNIDDFIALRGYPAYARRNVETYQEIEAGELAVLAVSSGFMTYPDDAHPRLSTIRRSIATLSSTVVLLPSLDLEACVAETLRRQRARPLAQHRTDAREEQVIRERFPVYDNRHHGYSFAHPPQHHGVGLGLRSLPYAQRSGCPGASGRLALRNSGRLGRR